MPAHYSVMKDIALDHLNLLPGKIVLDGTLGAGGHSYAAYMAVQPGGAVHSFDRDPEAVAFCRSRYPQNEFDNWHMYVGEISLQVGLPDTNAFIFDSGWSSRQLDLGRGFSYMADDEQLNLKFNPEDAGPTAQEWIDMASEEEIDEVLEFYGEEPLHSRLSSSIADQRPQGVKNLRQLIEKEYKKAYGPNKSTTHPATKTWQAMRIYINRELEAVENDVLAGLRTLLVGGRAVVITFHSLEDRLIKQLFNFAAGELKGEAPASWQTLPGVWKVITKDPLVPTTKEVKENPASRSAKIRVIEKIS